MKHLFFIHSGITLEISNQVIKEEKLLPSNCIFFINRINPKSIQPGVTSILINEHFDTYKDFNVSLFFIKPLINTIRFTSLIDHYVKGSSFKAYLPQHSLNVLHIITNHKKCKSFSYIEEGFSSYIPIKQHYISNKLVKKPSILTSFLFRLCFLDKVPREKKFFELASPNLDFLFSLSPYCFPDSQDKRKVLSVPFKKLTTNNKVTHLLIIEAFVEVRIMTISEYRVCLQNILLYLKKKNINNIHYKFHPSQSIEVKTLLEVLLHSHDKVNATEINENVITENLLFTFLPNIYHINSAVGIYASILGCNVSNFSKVAMKKIPYLKTIISELPEKIKEKTFFIE
jgi:hypothetical protein